MASESPCLTLTVTSLEGLETEISWPADGNTLELRKAVAEVFHVAPQCAQLIKDASVLAREGSLFEAGICDDCHISFVILPKAVPEYSSLVVAASATFEDIESMGNFCFGPEGTLLIADGYSERGVQLLNIFGEEALLVSDPGDRHQEEDMTPCEWGRGICSGHSGQSVFLSCTGVDWHAVREFSLCEPSVRAIKTIEPEFRYPSIMCLSPDGNTLAVLDAGTGPEELALQRIFLVNLQSSAKTIFVGGATGLADGHFSQYPTGIAFSPDGQQLLVSSDTRIQTFGVDGSWISKIDVGEDVTSLIVDILGNILVVVQNVCLKVFSPHGTLLHDLVGGQRWEQCISGVALDPSTGRIVLGACSGPYTPCDTLYLLNVA